MKILFILKNINTNEVLLLSPKYGVLSEALGKMDYPYSTNFKIVSCEFSDSLFNMVFGQKEKYYGTNAFEHMNELKVVNTISEITEKDKLYWKGISDGFNQAVKILFEKLEQDKERILNK